MLLRQHYRCVGEKGLDPEKSSKELWSKITADAVIEHASKDQGLDPDPENRLSAEEIGIKKYIITHGLKGNRHPLDHVKFFGKHTQNQKAYELPLGKRESMIPKHNESWIVRCYVKPSNRAKYEQAQAAFSGYCSDILGGQCHPLGNERGESQLNYRESQLQNSQLMR